MSKIAYVLSHEQFPVTDLLEFGVAAEQAGFDAVWTSDHFHPWMDNQGHAGQAWVTLAALGQRMPRIPFGTGVTCPTFRYHPAIVAQAFATLGLLYPGRVFLGLGTGEALNERPVSGEWGDYEERADRLLEAVQVIRQLWSGNWVEHKGQYYTVEGARIYNLPAQPVPIYIAAEGLKSMHLVGMHGDGLITDSKSALEPALRTAFEEGVRAAGKQLSSMEVLAEHFVVVGGPTEAKAAAAKWRFIPKAWSDYVDIPDPREIERRAEAEVPLAEVTQNWVVSDDPAEHAAAIQKLFDGGVTQVYVHAGNADQHQAISFYGQQVLPRLRRGRERTAS